MARTAAEKMLAAKRRLVARLKKDIADVQTDADWQIERIRGRIRIAESLIDSLEKGTLKP